MFTINLSIHDDDYSHATLIHLSSYRSIQKVWLINDLYEDIVIYFSYSNRWNIKNGLTDCGEPPRVGMWIRHMFYDVAMGIPVLYNDRAYDPLREMLTCVVYH